MKKNIVIRLNIGLLFGEGKIMYIIEIKKKWDKNFYCKVYGLLVCVI